MYDTVASISDRCVRVAGLFVERTLASIFLGVDSGFGRDSGIDNNLQRWVRVRWSNGVVLFEQKLDPRPLLRRSAVFRVHPNTRPSSGTDDHGSMQWLDKGTWTPC